MKWKAIVFYDGGAGLVQPESLIRGTRARENGVLPESGRARIVLPNITRLRPRGSDYEEITMRTRGNSRSPTRVRDTRKIFAVHFSRESGYGQFREPGGAVPRGGVCKNGEAPARMPREARREGAGGAQRRATRPVPLTQNLRGKHSTSPESFSAERVLPAPRAGERTLFAFLQWLRPLRPDTGTSCTKHRIPRFFTSAFPGLLARHKDSFVPAPRG